MSKVNAKSFQTLVTDLESLLAVLPEAIALAQTKDDLETQVAQAKADLEAQTAKDKEAKANRDMIQAAWEKKLADVQAEIKVATDALGDANAAAKKAELDAKRRIAKAGGVDGQAD